MEKCIIRYIMGDGSLLYYDYGCIISEDPKNGLVFAINENLDNVLLERTMESMAFGDQVFFCQGVYAILIKGEAFEQHLQDDIRDIKNLLHAQKEEENKLFSDIEKKEKYLQMLLRIKNNQHNKDV